jgi:hypothetical protein
LEKNHAGHYSKAKQTARQGFKSLMDHDECKKTNRMLYESVRAGFCKPSEADAAPPRAQG